MKLIRKRLFALLISFVMTLGIVMSPGGITAAALDATVDLSSLTANYTISESGSYAFSGALADGYHIVVNPNISGDVNISLSGMKIGTDEIPPKTKTVSALEIGSGTTVNLTVTGVNYLIGANAPGILVPDGATLIIDGAGKLSTICTAYSMDQSAAGIGGAKDGTCGTITINGGALIKAIAYRNSAGIGSGYQGSGGSITINGGMVEASAGGVGGGAAIGSGFKATGNCSVTINGGNVRASSIDFSAAIGNGYGSTGAKVTITGGSVTAVSGGSGAAIGNGEGIADHQSSCTVLISGGTVTATGPATKISAGIGGGLRGNGCDLTITGGTVTTFGYTGIGPGEYGPSAGSCIVTGGSVKITSISAEQAPVYYDAASTPAYPVSLTVPGITAATEVSYSINSGSTVSCATDTTGKLYLWLPAQTNAAVSVTAGSNTFVFSGAVSSTGTNTLTTQLSSEKAITVFGFNGLTPAVSGTINESGKTISLTVPYGTDLTALVPTITHTGANISPNTGVAQNFSSLVTYTVTAEDTTNQPYTVSVTVSTPAETLANTLTGLGFTAAASGSTVTVTGTKTVTDTLGLTIPTGVKVLWKASLTGAITVLGSGTFELAGGSITNSGTEPALLCVGGSLIISGGSVSSANNCTVLTNPSPACPLTITGGTVTSTSSDKTAYAISAGGKTLITGGTITAASGNQVLLNNAVIVYRSDLLSTIASNSLSTSVAIDPSKTYAIPGETEGLTATGYSATAGNVSVKWAVFPSGEGTGVWVDYTYGTSGSGSWRVSYPAVTVVSAKHSLTYDANGGSGSMTDGTVYCGQSYTVSANAFTKSGCGFTGWNTQADGKGTAYAAGAVLTGADNSNPITLYAQWSTIGGSGSVPSSGGSSSTTPSTPASGSTATTTATAKTGADGKAAASVTQSQLSDALDKAKSAAGTNGTPEVKIQIDGASGASSVGTTIPQASVQALVSGNAGALTISSPTGAVTFDAAALKTISDAASGDVTVTASKVDTSTLPDTAKQAVGSHPVYEFSVTSGGETISQFGGSVTVSVPYTPAAGEDTNAIVIYYIAADGTLTMVPDARYDAATGAVIFTTTHFSTYAVGYNKMTFTDVSDTAWYSGAVTFLAARGITSGTTATSFSPDATLTRGQFITMLLRAYGITADENPTDNFSDAGNNYYTNYLAAAKRMGISNGVGNNLFAPEQEITRQEMFTLLYNALSVINQLQGSKLPDGSSGTTLSSFSDAGQIASWAKEAITQLAEAGVISGSSGKLSPTGSATRAEMAQLLYNLLIW